MGERDVDSDDVIGAGPILDGTASEPKRKAIARGISRLLCVSIILTSIGCQSGSHPEIGAPAADPSSTASSSPSSRKKIKPPKLFSDPSKPTPSTSRTYDPRL